jgi:uncharacterized membrane protein
MITFLAVVTLIMLLILFISFITFRSDSVQKIDSLLKQTEDIRRYLRSYEIVNPNVVETKVQKEEIKIEPIISVVKEEISEKAEEEKIVVHQEIQPEKIVVPEEKVEKTEPQFIKTETTDKIYQPQNQVKTQPAKAKNDLEKFIGENLLVKIAVAILVLGVSFLIKWAIDNEWINEIGRVSIGFTAGAALLTLGYVSRKNYNAFSSVLTGGGLAALYVSVTLGFQLYHLFSQSAAFVILILITIASVAMALGYDKRELAVFAILGGFASPFMVATGHGNYIVLFTYIILLDLGMLVLAYFKKWNIVNIISLAATMILYGGWLGSAWYDINVPYRNALLFGSAFFLIFFLMFIISNIREKKKFSAFEMILLLSVTFAYYTAGMFIIHKFHPEYKGLYTICLAVFNFIFLYPLYKKQQVDSNLIFLLTAVVLTFLSLAAPVQLNGQYITLFWAAESVALLWISQKSEMKLIRIASVLVFFLTAGSLLMDWYQIYIDPPVSEKTLPILINKAFITSIVVIISMILNFRLLKNDTFIHVFNKFPAETFKIFNIVFILVFMYFAFMLELNYQLNARVENFHVRNVYIGLYDLIYITGILFWAGINKYHTIFNILIGLTYFALLSFIFFFDIDYADLLQSFVNGEISNHHYFFHLITVLIAVSGGILIIKFYADKAGYDNKITKSFLWISVILVVVIFSRELLNIALISKKQLFIESMKQNQTLYYYEGVKDAIFENVYRIWFPVLWGVCAFALMLLGMRKEVKDLRIIALALVFLTLGKLLLFDVWKMSQVGRVISFISLGLILLIVAFLYQKLKKLVLGDEEKNSELK